MAPNSSGPAVAPVPAASDAEPADPADHEFGARRGQDIRDHESGAGDRAPAGPARADHRRRLAVRAPARAARRAELTGIGEYLRGEADELAVIQHGQEGNLCFIAGGAKVTDPSELLSNGRLKKLLDRVTPVFDWVIIDSPPCLPVADATILANYCDGILLVVRAGSTASEVAQGSLPGIAGQERDWRGAQRGGSSRTCMAPTITRVTDTARFTGRAKKRRRRRTRYIEAWGWEAQPGLRKSIRGEGKFGLRPFAFQPHSFEADF